MPKIILVAGVVQEQRLAAVADKHEGVMGDLKLVHGGSPLNSKVHLETTPETLISIKSAGPPKSLLMRTGRRRSLCRTYENRPAALSNLYTSMQICACKYRGDIPQKQ